MQPIWKWKTFKEFTAAEIYAVLRLRQEVFVVEQNCPYLDCDDRDQQAHHLCGWLEHGSRPGPVAYLRLLPPAREIDPPMLGRLLTRNDHRGQGLAHGLMERALARLEKLYPHSPVAISAQSYLEDFYATYGFVTRGPSYLEDGIPHITMHRPRGL